MRLKTWRIWEIKERLYMGVIVGVKKKPSRKDQTINVQAKGYLALARSKREADSAARKYARSLCGRGYAVSANTGLFADAIKGLKSGEGNG